LVERDRPLIGFFPAFGSMGETVPLVKIAKAYGDVGGESLFFSHGGQFEYLAEEIGARIVHLDRHIESIQPEQQRLYKDGVPWEEIMARRFTAEAIAHAVEEEVKALRGYPVDLVVSSFVLSCIISARVVGVPLVSLASGISTPVYARSGRLTIPEEYENVFTRILPRSWKNRVAGWYLLHSKRMTGEFNKVASQYHVPSFRYSYELFFGDETLICDDIHFLGVQPTREFPLNNYIGPLIAGNPDLQKGALDADVERHLGRPGRSIVLSLGSSYNYLAFFPRLVETLNETQYNVIILYKDFKKHDWCARMHEKILFKEFVPMGALLKRTDLAITTGGRGAIYSIAFSGKPAVCIPMIYEHQCNIENLVRAGAGVRLSKKNIDSARVLQAIDRVFHEYPMFLENARRLQGRLSMESGEKMAVQRLMEIQRAYRSRKQSS
jgi:UDP:flavonoid glycosyltransferase YjiC (YdhE family)